MIRDIEEKAIFVAVRLRIWYDTNAVIYWADPYILSFNLKNLSLRIYALNLSWSLDVIFWAGPYILSFNLKNLSLESMP